MIITLVLVSLLVWFLCVGWLYWYFIGSEHNRDNTYTLGSFWIVDCQPFYGGIVTITALDPVTYPNGVLVRGHSKDTNRVIDVWVNRDLLKELEF